MKRFLPGLLLTLTLTLALAAGARGAEPYKPGDVFEPFTTKDQHEQSYTFTPGVRTVIVSFAMGSGKDANQYLEKQPANFLASHQAVFIANIHGMPGIGRMFALPKMKKYPHRILLADDEHFLDRYPSRKDHLTVFTLDPQGRIDSINFIDPARAMPSIFAAKR